MFDFGDRLKQLRLQRGVTQKQLGIDTGTSERAIQNYELGMRKPTYEILIALANYFHVSLDYLVGNGIFANWNDVLEHWDKIMESVCQVKIDNGSESISVAELVKVYSEQTHGDKIKMSELLAALISKIEFDKSGTSVAITICWKF